MPSAYAAPVQSLIDELGRLPGIGPKSAQRIAFHLLKGPDRDDHVLYASHSLWRSEAAFLTWTHSEAFRKAHESAGGNKPLYLGHPELEGFTVLQEVNAEGALNKPAAK